ncbi:hypothetical protein LOTGIDRAFT_154707 [Lottia gigantea]|uniref:Uncharacterized protein n=1 Tax=Lottia gigantea TaxID=225164 RepID=V3Z8H3_LOTGI|nr:hypothetical protein LOTGIDRAFT_154707 [Lottia gigantea]ESO87203.1 hypothetical protein LOTGIDRAFT_154707 [Lottia gigantea]
MGDISVRFLVPEWFHMIEHGSWKSTMNQTHPGMPRDYRKEMYNKNLEVPDKRYTLHRQPIEKIFRESNETRAIYENDFISKQHIRLRTVKCRPNKMKFHQRTFAYKFGVFLCIISVPSAILGLGFPTWKKDSVSMHGLFQTCGKLLDFSTCTTIDLYSYGAWFEAVRALEIISIILMFFDVIFMIRRKPSRLEGFDAFIVALLYISGPAVYAYYVKATDFGQGAVFSWGFILACFSGGLAGTGAICMCGSEFTPDNRIEPYSERQKEKKRQKKKMFSPKDWNRFPDHGSHLEKDYYRDYYKDRDPEWDYLHRF